MVGTLLLLNIIVLTHLFPRSHQNSRFRVIYKGNEIFSPLIFKNTQTGKLA